MLKGLLQRHHGTAQTEALSVPSEKPSVADASETLGRVVLGAEPDQGKTPVVTEVSRSYEMATMEFQLPDTTRTTEDLTLLTGQNSDIYWLLVNDPVAHEGMIAHGPAYFDMPESRQHARYVQVFGNDIPDRANDKPYTIFWYQKDNAGLIHHRGTRAHITNLSRHLTPSTVEGQQDAYGRPRPLAVETSLPYIEYRDQDPYHRLAAIREAFRYLGFDKGQFPSPQTFQARMDQLCATDKTSGLYFPKIRLLPGGGLKATPYLSAYADKEHAVATNSFLHYFHDVASEHLQALMEDGEPLMDLLAAFAQIALDPKKTITFDYQRSPNDVTGTLAGEDKLKQATVTIDAMTMLMAKRHGAEAKTQDELLSVADCIVNAVKGSRKAKRIPFITDMLKSKRIQTVDELTGKTVVNEVSRLTLQRLANAA